MGGALTGIILVTAAMELLEPYVAAYMEVFNRIACILLLGNPLLNDTTLYDNRLSLTVCGAVLKLSDTEQGCVGYFKPISGLTYTQVV